MTCSRRSGRRWKPGEGFPESDSRAVVQVCRAAMAVGDALGSHNATLQQILDELASGELLCGPRSWPAAFWKARARTRHKPAYAHQRGMRVSGHVPAFMRAREVVERGFDEINHINQVLLNFLVTPETDTRTLERFVLPAERLATLDLNSRAVRDFVALLKRRQTVIDPTAVTFAFIQQREGEVSPTFAPVLDHLPPTVQRWFLSGGMKIADDAAAARYKASYAAMVKFIGQLYRAGVPLVAGTDEYVVGMALHSELALYVQAGLTPAQALQVATRNGAKYAGTLNDRGSITPGKLADLVLVDGDPTKDIADLRRVALVITQGRLISPSAVYAALGIKPFVTQTPTLRPVGVTAVAAT